MVRITGSVKDENSLSSPTGDLLSSVVRCSNGKREKRINGTESRALTSTEPSPSSSPRKERLLSGGNSDGLVLGSVVFSKSRSNMKLLNYRRRKIWNLRRKAAISQDLLLLLRQISDVGHHFLYVLWGELGAKSWHSPVALVNNISKLSITLRLNLL